METVYLKNGQQADLIREVDGKFLVAPYYTYNGYEGEEYSEAGTSLEMVTEVFKSAPVEKLQEDYKSLLEQLKKAQELAKDVEIEKNKAISQYQSLVKQTTDLEKFIINRGELKKAKTFTVFPDKEFLPISYPNPNYNGFKINVVINIQTGEEQAWAYKLYKDYNDSYGHYVDMKSGILCDLSEEEIDRITKERIASRPVDYFSRSRIDDVDDRFLTPELIDIKNKAIAESKQKSIVKLNKEISDAQEKLKLLEAKKEQVI
jgi:hypothetical protein